MSDSKLQRPASRNLTHLVLDPTCGEDINIDDYTPGPATVTNKSNFRYGSDAGEDHVNHVPDAPRSQTVSVRSERSNTLSLSNNRENTYDRASMRSHSPEPVRARSASVSSRISIHRRSPSNISVQSLISLTSANLVTKELEEPTVFVNPPRKGLVCMICQSIFQDPVLAKCGHSFCRKCITGVPPNGTCPHASHRSIVLNKTNLITNISIVEELAELKIHCQHGLKLVEDGGDQQYVVDPDGCPDTVSMGEREAHESICSFRKMECPNSASCGTFRQNELEAHLAQCQNYSCPHANRGCVFVGSHAALQDHLQSACRFELVKDVLQDETRIQRLSESLESKDQEIEFLKTTVAKLADRLLELESRTGAQLTEMAEHVDQTSRAVVAMQQEMGHVQNKLGLIDQLQDAQTTSHVFKCIGTFVGHQGPVWALRVHGNVLFSGSSDETVKVWDTRSTASFKVKKTLQNHRGIVHALCTHEEFLYSGSQDCTINVWDIENLVHVDTLIGHDNPVCTLAVANNMLFSGSLKVVNIWDLQSRQLVGCLSGFNHWVRALIATPEYLFAGSYQVVSIWSSRPSEILPKLDEGEELLPVEELRTNGGSIYSVCITEKYIICGTYEHLVHLWDGSTLEEVKTLSGHSGTVYALAVMPGSANGRDRLFSASYDRTIRVWCLEQFACLQILARHENSVDALAVHRGWLFSGAADSNIKVWQ